MDGKPVLVSSELSKLRSLERMLTFLAWGMRKIPLQRGKFRLVKSLPLGALLHKGYFRNYVFTAHNDIIWDASTLSDLMTKHMFWCGSYQDDVLTCFRLFLQEGDVVFDIGAHFGLMSLVASKLVGSSGRVVAFEPNVHVRQVLEHHLELNRATNITIEPIGLLDKAGTFDLYMTDVSWNCTFVKEFAGLQKYEKTKVPVDTLDEYVQRTGIRPDFIKIDTEGTEYNCLLGGQETLGTLKPVIVTEFNAVAQASPGDDARRLLYFLKQHGYRFFVFTKSFLGSFSRHDFNEFSPDDTIPDNSLFNILCIHDTATDKLNLLYRKG